MIQALVDGKELLMEEGTAYLALAQRVQASYPHRILLAVADGKVRELFHTVKEGARITFLTGADRVGHDTLVRSAVMLLMKAARDVCGEREGCGGKGEYGEGKGESGGRKKTGGSGDLKVEFTIGCGLYCSPKNGLVVDEAFVSRVKARMWELVRRRLPYKKQVYSTSDAVALFASQKMEDKVKLFRYRRSSYTNIYCLDGYFDYYYGYMAPDTGYVEPFDLVLRGNGLMLVLPNAENPEELPALDDRPKLFETLVESSDWGSRIGIDTVGDLNEKICDGDLADLILVQEALQESRIGYIASLIASRKHVKFVMIAGPSSSGKTTFSHRLSIQLRTHGLAPHPIAVDNYFVDRELTPRDADGKYNFECLEAIDVKRLNRDMCDLLEGKTVELPEYNFRTGHREYKGNFLTLGRDDILVIEGIHGLNDQMSYALPAESKFKIYISALTSLNVDEHNRISTTDGRLLRRMVRDARSRGISARQTLSQWPSVRRGEEENIFPWQESADVMFNSALIYELSVLKQYAEPLLYGIRPEDPEYQEAKRLLKFLDYFLGVGGENLPANSIVREFVGGSCFRV